MSVDDQSPLLDVTARAIELLARNGYESTTSAELADTTGMSRSTYFRRFGSKENIVFADHDLLLQRVQTELREHQGDPLQAVSDGARLVLRHHLRRSEVSRFRHDLLQNNPVLRDRELVTSNRYERAFFTHLRQALPQADTSEWMLAAFSASIVSVHNLTLRSWLRGREADPEAMLEQRSRTLVLAYRAMIEARVPGHAPAGRRLFVGVIEPEQTAAQALAELAASLHDEL